MARTSPPCNAAKDQPSSSVESAASASQAVYDGRNLRVGGPVSLFLAFAGERIRKIFRASESDAWSQDSYDEDERVSEIVRKGKFFCKLSYINDKPVLRLTASDVRCDTNLGSSQGDHVNAYVLIIQSIACCEGERVFDLPDILCQLAVRLFPQDRATYEREAKEVNDKRQAFRRNRKNATALFRKNAEYSAEGIKSIKQQFKRAELELIARYVEDFADAFIQRMNKEKNAAFPTSRKENVLPLILNSMEEQIHADFQRLEKEYPATRGKESLLQQATHLEKMIIEAVRDTADAQPVKGKEKKAVTDNDIKTAASLILKKAKDVKRMGEIIIFFLGSAKEKSQEGMLQTYLKKITVLKKQSESSAMENLEKMNRDMKKGKADIDSIAKSMFALFDYPFVGDVRKDSLEVLAKALARHLILIFSAFKNLSALDTTAIIDSFLRFVLEKQLWKEYKTQEGAGSLRPLNIERLREKVNNYMDLTVEPAKFELRVSAGRQ